MGRLEDIEKRNRQGKGGPGGMIGGLIRSELTDPMADSTDIKNRILAIAIVVGLIVAIVIAAKLL